MHWSTLLRPSLRHQSAQAAARLAAPRPTPAALEQSQLSAVRAVWADAIADIPYYASLIAAGSAPGVIGTWADLQSIPPLTRQIIQERSAEFTRRSSAPASTMITAGSTGTPIALGMGRAEQDLMRVVKLAEWQAFGYTPGARLFLIWGHSHLLGTGWRRHYKHARRRLADAFLGYRRVDAYRLTPALCEQHAQAILRFRPIGIVGYASVLDLFARYTAAYRDRLRAVGIRFVLSTAEAPPRPDSLATIEQHFGCPVVQEYGGAEFGQVAFKASSAPFHVYGDLNFVECEPRPGDGSEQPILVTALYPRYVPLIRYRVGDSVVAPVRLHHGHVDEFAEVGGRINDVLHFADGAAIHSVAIFHCLHQEPAVFNIQMILRDSGIDICLVSASADRPAMEARMRQRLSQVHPQLGACRFVYADDVQTSRAGKRRWFVDLRTKI